MENLPQSQQLTYMNSKANEVIDLLDDIRVCKSEIREKIWQLLLKSLPFIKLKTFLDFIRRLSKNECFQKTKKDELGCLLEKLKTSEVDCINFYRSKRDTSEENNDCAKLYEEVQNMNFSLLAKVGSALEQQYHILKKKVLKLDLSKLEPKLTCQRIPFLMEECSFVSQKLKGPEGLIALVDILKPRETIEEISNAYWYLIPNGSPKYLKIEHAGKILDLGIRSDQDFLCLGLTYQKQNLILNIRKTIETFILKIIAALPDDAIQENKESKEQEPIKLLRKKLQICYEELLKLSVNKGSTKFFVTLLKLFKSLKMAKIPDEEHIAWMQHILKEIKDIKMKTDKEEKRLTSLLLRLEGAPTKDALKTLCGDILAFAVVFFKDNDFLEMLKLYLTQPDLDSIWKMLHEQDIHTLSQLFDLQMIPNLPHDCYRLAALIDNLNPEKKT